MRILLTGRTGFVGSHLYGRLIEQGHEVFSLARHVAGRYEYLKSEEEKFVFGDLTDHARIKEIVESLKPDAVIHLAAKTPVSLSFSEPLDYWAVVASGTVNLVEACRGLKNLEKFIHASTSEIYGVQEEFPIKETALPNPVSPYAVAKIAAEEYLKMLGKVYNFPYIIVRPFNSYGRRKIRHYVVERAITTLLEKGEIQLWNPVSIRDFMYVDDHANGYLAVLEKGKPGEIYNLCTEQGTSIREMTDIVLKIAEEEYGIKGKASFKLPADRPYEIKVLVGSREKAQRELGWAPKVTLEEGLRRTFRYWAEELGVVGRIL